MKKIVREKLNEIKRSEPTAKSIGVGSYRMMIDEITRLFASVGCTYSEKTFVNVTEPEIIKEYDWMSAVFGVKRELIGMITDYRDDSEVRICDIMDRILNVIKTYADIDEIKQVTFKNVTTEFGTAEKVTITANSVVALIDEVTHSDEGDCFVFINANKILLPDDMSESQRHSHTAERINEIKRGGSERESMGVGYVGAIKEILSDTPPEHYHRGEDTSADTEESIQISEIIQEVFNCDEEDIDIIDLGTGPYVVDVINRLRKYITDENDVHTVTSDHSSYDIRFGRYFAVVVERNTMRSDYGDNSNYFHIALDNRHIRLY
jgi:hypothetical protein